MTEWPITKETLRVSNSREKTNFIRQVADDTLRVREVFKAHEYGDVILPFVVFSGLGNLPFF